MIDLHIHTHYSDGKCGIKEIFHSAKRAGLTAISITDHNSIDGYTEAYKESKNVNIEFIPGVELSCINKDGKLTEILGYMMDVRTRNFHRMLKEANQYYSNFFRKSLNHLEKSTKYNKAYQAIKSFYYCFNSNYFLKTFSRSFVFNSFNVLEAIKTIKSLGGISVLSHPRAMGIRIVENTEIIELAKQGLDGIEVYHSGHSEEDIKELLSLSKELGLLVTGGSDFHGRKNENVYLGKFKIEYSLLENMKDRRNDIKVSNSLII